MFRENKASFVEFENKKKCNDRKLCWKWDCLSLCRKMKICVAVSKLVLQATPQAVQPCKNLLFKIFQKISRILSERLGKKWALSIFENPSSHEMLNHEKSGELQRAQISTNVDLHPIFNQECKSSSHEPGELHKGPGISKSSQKDHQTPKVKHLWLHDL